MAHGADNGEAVAVLGHVEIADEDVEGLGANEGEGIVDVGRGVYFEAIEFEDLGN